MEKKATRDGYGQALLELGRQRSDIVVLDADLSESTRTSKFAKEFPDRFVNVGVAEQNLVGMAAGFALSGLTPFASSFAMFLSGRAWEVVRNSVAYPELNVKLVSTHAGLTVGEDGASHQCVEDIAIMQAIPGMRVFVPADFDETIQIINRVAEISGPCYVRCGRAALPVLPHAVDYSFREGKGELLRDGEDVTIIACGPLVYEGLRAAELLQADGISAAVINMASVKPIDEELILAFARKTGGIVAAEEHNIHGGLGAAVCRVVCAGQPVPVECLGMADVFGQSGPADTLMDFYKLRAEEIVKRCRRILKK